MRIHIFKGADKELELRKKKKKMCFTLNVRKLNKFKWKIYAWN